MTPIEINKKIIKRILSAYYKLRIDMEVNQLSPCDFTENQIVEMIDEIINTEHELK